MFTGLSSFSCVESDMRTGGPSFGTPESVFGSIAGGQLARRYGMPYRGGGGTNKGLILGVAGVIGVLSIVGLMYALHPWVAYAFMAASMVYYARLSTVFLVAMVVWGHKVFAAMPSFFSSSARPSTARLMPYFAMA